jgi:hypothetical protein
MGTDVMYASRAMRHGFLRKVLGIVAAQLLLTAAVAAPILLMPGPQQWLASNRWALPLACILTFGTLIALVCSEGARRAYPTNLVLLGIFTGAQGVLVGVACAAYDTPTVVLAVVLTAAVCLALVRGRWDGAAPPCGGARGGARGFGSRSRLCARPARAAPPPARQSGMEGPLHAAAACARGPRDPGGPAPSAGRARGSRSPTRCRPSTTSPRPAACCTAPSGCCCSSPWAPPCSGCGCRTCSSRALARSCSAAIYATTSRCAAKRGPRRPRARPQGGKPHAGGGAGRTGAVCVPRRPARAARVAPGASWERCHLGAALGPPLIDARRIAGARPARLPAFARKRRRTRAAARACAPAPLYRASRCSATPRPPAPCPAPHAPRSRAAPAAVVRGALCRDICRRAGCCGAEHLRGHE